MALYDDPPHTCTIYSSSNAADSAGGHATTYAVRQASVPCSIGPPEASTQLRFAQANIEIVATIGILTEKLTSAVQRGDKVVGSDSRSYHLEGIAAGEAYGNIPQFTYLHCSALL